MRQHVLIAAILVVTVLPLAAGGRLQQVLERHFAAIGQNSLDRKQTLVWKGTSNAGPFTLYQKRPDKVRIDATYQGADWIRGYNGETAWIIAPWLDTPEAQPLTEGPQYTQLLALSQFDGPIHHPERFGGKLEYVGKADIDGQPGFKLRLTDRDGARHHIFIDAKNHFLVKQVSFATDEKTGKEYEIVTLFKDYRKVDGVYLAFRYELISPDGTNPIVIESLEVDTDLPDSMFEKPAGASTAKQ